MKYKGSLVEHNLMPCLPILYRRLLSVNATQGTLVTYVSRR